MGEARGKRTAPKKIGDAKVNVKVMNRIEIPDGAKIILDKTINTGKGRRVGRIVLVLRTDGSYGVLGEAQTFMDRNKLHVLCLQFLRKLEAGIQAITEN